MRGRTRLAARLGLAMGGAAVMLAASLALAITPATSASAHDYLVSSTPTAGSTVTTAVPTVTLVFDDIVLDDGGHGALVQVTNGAGRNFETGCASVQGRDVSVPVALGTSGTYRVTWQIVSADGHPVSNSIQFDYRGPVAGDGHSGPLTKCGTSVRAPAAQGSGTAAASKTAISPAIVGILIAAGAVVLLAAVAVIITVLRAGRRSHPVD